jgi:hypothetical protein
MLHPNMLHPRGGKRLANENEYPNIAELSVAGDGLEVELSRRIIDFHKSRHIELRHGRTINREGETYYRWCFADSATARAFFEQFGGALCSN